MAFGLTGSGSTIFYNSSTRFSSFWSRDSTVLIVTLLNATNATVSCAGLYEMPDTVVARFSSTAIRRSALVAPVQALTITI